MIVVGSPLKRGSWVRERRGGDTRGEDQRGGEQDQGYATGGRPAGAQVCERLIEQDQRHCGARRHRSGAQEPPGGARWWSCSPEVASWALGLRGRRTTHAVQSPTVCSITSRNLSRRSCRRASVGPPRRGESRRSHCRTSTWSMSARPVQHWPGRLLHGPMPPGQGSGGWAARTVPGGAAPGRDLLLGTALALLPVGAGLSAFGSPGRPS